ncbi:DNA binding domain-containing protein, excisionase family [Halobacillus dabanensis]|uniref:DNA binding domain-containing protein, excisionase family n=1 Tax=Halobacillus dabanensis TaxID=240302 RepID=A0A1I3TVK1_HALDA|nr:excisionase family DNA-binding protein [Halobacillus dabanensis]SFJ74349.1 DNA binding domain-containing protein, excisionase family [Halobacillus dabanensis]
MYMTIKETAEYLEVPKEYLHHLILHNKIRTVHDGDQYLINKDQFQSHMEQMEKYRRIIQEYLSEPLPEDPDVKDED